MPRIIVKYQGRETVYDKAEDVTTIGRSEESSLSLDDPTVSHNHCRIEKGATGGECRFAGIVEAVLGVGTEASKSGEIHRAKRSYLHTQHLVCKRKGAFRAVIRFSI